MPFAVIVKPNQTMKKTILLLALATFAVVAAYGQPDLKLMTYNIRNANGMDEVRDFDRIASVITTAQPDVVAVQEVDSLTGRSGQKYVLGEIAARTAMNAYFCAAIDYDGGKYGIGLLAKDAPLRVERMALPGREESRALLVAEFADFVFCCTHLSLTEEDRMESLKLIKKLAAKYHKPFYIAGDMNDLPNSQFISELERDFRIISNTQHPTYPAPDPQETIDYIAVAKRNAGKIAVTSAEVIAEPVASDHRPVVVNVSVAKKR